ncbi:hypothetical protein MMC30_000988 [Trapelia coarctata]|nr:hypothetical protein [Trapelia coarctata]
MLTEQESICLQSLYTSDYRQHKERNPKRVPGTCEWLLEHPKYMEWINAQVSSLLWVSADAGCGKSVLASFLIEKLRTDISKDHTTVCYFFFKDDNTEQRTSPSAFCAMVHQILADDLTLIKHAMAQYQLKGRKYAEEFGSLWDILVAITADGLQGRNVICILDGLDECEKVNRIQMIEYLEKFYSKRIQSPDGSKFFLKFLITSRPGVLVEDTFFDLPTIRLRAEDETMAISHDIELVVQDTIASIGRRRKIPTDQQSALVQQIIGNADRTFLWVTLVLQRIQSSERFSKAAIKELVETIPPDLDGVYNKILSESSKSQYTRKLLEIIVGAFRPLSLGELNVAFVIQPTNKSPQDLDLEPDMESTVKSLCGIFLRVIDSTIYLAHQTAREFLLKPTEPSPVENSNRALTGPWKHSFYPRDTNQTWAQICRWYIMFTIFEENPLYIAPDPNVNLLKGEVEEYTNQYTLLSYTARFWPDHFRIWGVRRGDASLESYLPLYEPESKRFKTWYQIYWMAAYGGWSLGPQGNTPLIVAAYFGHTEVVKMLVSNDKTGIERFRSLFIKKEEDPINAKDKDGMSSLTWAVQNGHLETVRFLLEQRNINVNCRDALRKTPLIRAASKGHLEIVKLLLSRSDTIADARGDREETALACAATNDNPAIAQLLMSRKDVNINNKECYGETPLYNAVRHGSLEIIRILLAYPEIELDFTDPRLSLLSAAAECGSPEVLQLVLELAEKTGKSFNLKRAVLYAAEKGNTSTLQKLLSLDPSLLNAPNDDAQTPLSLAAMWGHIDSTRFLLTQPGIDINALDKYHCTPITWAISWSGGTPEIVDMLLAREEIDTSNQNHNGDTPLFSAVEKENEQIFLSLFHRSEVDINHRNKTRFTPLITAANRGHLRFVELLLSREEVEINAQDETGMTAVAWAAYMGHVEVIRILLANGADFNLKDKQGLTPVMHAAKKDEKMAVNVLLKATLRASLVGMGVEERRKFLERVPVGLRAVIDVEGLVGSGG